MSKIEVVWFKDLRRWDVSYFSGIHSFSSKFKLEYLEKILQPRKEKIKINEYDGVTPIVAKIPFQQSHIEYRKELKTKMDMYAVYQEDLLVSNINFHQGAVAICDKQKVYASTHYQPYIINNESILSKFLILMLKQKRFQEYVATKKVKGIKTESNFNFIKTLQIPLPPLEIQKEIVQKIQSIQDKIKALQEGEKRLKEEIEAYIYTALGLKRKEERKKQKIFVVDFKNLERWDISYNQNNTICHSKRSEETMQNNRTKYPPSKIGNICFINPNVDFKELIKNDKKVSFLPMRAVSSNGIEYSPKEKNAVESKGFVKFQNGDLLWAKITPCMQNKKSVVVDNLLNGNGFGSTEFFVMRAKNKNEADIRFILYFLRLDSVINEAKLSFKGSAGQQRVPKSFLENLLIPLPPLEIQQQIIENIESKQKIIEENKNKIKNLQSSIDNKFQEFIFA